MSSSLPSEAGLPSRRVSTPAMPTNFFPQSPDHHGSQVLHTPQRKGSVTGPPLSPLQSPPPTINFNTGTPTEKVLCRPYRHVPDAEIADSFNNVEVHNSHDRVSMPNMVNEGVPPPKPPRRVSANPRMMMEFSNDIVNGSRSNTASPELGGAIEEPPPIPIKKNRKKPLG